MAQPTSDGKSKAQRIRELSTQKLSTRKVAELTDSSDAYVRAVRSRDRYGGQLPGEKKRRQTPEYKAMARERSRQWRARVEART